jgi:hypothetical protein
VPIGPAVPGAHAGTRPSAPTSHSLHTAPASTSTR